MHNKALNIAVICREMVINHVFIYDGSGLNISPLSTLRQLRFYLGSLNKAKSMLKPLMGCRETHFEH